MGLWGIVGIAPVNFAFVAVPQANNSPTRLNLCSQQISDVAPKT